MVEEGLQAVASQTIFARLVGVSQQTISKQIEKGILSKEGTYRDWLLSYTDHLREQAAGRGGDNQLDIARATIEEKAVKTALGRITYHEKLGTLVDKEETQTFLSDWAGYSNKQFLQAFERLILDIQSQFDVTVPPELREKHAGSAIERVRGYALKLGEDSHSGSADVPTPESAAHSRVSGD